MIGLGQLKHVFSFELNIRSLPEDLMGNALFNPPVHRR